MAPPQLVGSSTLLGSQPVSNVSLTPVVIPRPSSVPSTNGVVDSKDDIIDSVRRAIEKREVAQEMSGSAPWGSSVQISRRMVQRRGLMRLLSSAPPHPRDVLVIPNNDVQQFESIKGAS